MAAPADWASRRFEFPFATDVYPSVMMRLRGTPARLEELLRGADDAALRLRPAEGKWSPLERAGHLIQVEALWRARVEDFLAGAEVLSPADMTNLATKEADYNRHAIEDVLAGFRAVRAEFMQRLDALVAEDFGRSALHPRLKVTMRIVDALYFTAEHDDHELAWIWELTR